MSIPFKEGNILIPKNIDMNKWSVVACDQYTSELDYWKKVREYVKDNPSTLNLILPEVYLNDKDVNDRINSINTTMQQYLDSDMFTEYENSMIYVERTQNDGRVREGLIGVVDLEDYSYEDKSSSLIRATEQTVIDRIPPRVKVRENASLELPHIMLLIDDDQKQIIEPLKNKVTDKIYDFDLMMKGGHIKGYKLNSDLIKQTLLKLEEYADRDYFEDKYDVKDHPVMLFDMGDGNHSLATAKTCYEKLKKKLSREEYLNHPSRYALVEVVNLHSKALQFESINRVLFDIDTYDFIKELYKFYDINEYGEGQRFELLTKELDEILYISNPKSNDIVGTIQTFIDYYLSNHKGRVDYVHGIDTTVDLGEQDNNLSIILDPMSKDDLFESIILDGSLPRKTFSMGHPYDKRYYLEARSLVLTKKY